MLVNYQNLFLDLMLLISVLELALCLSVGALDRRPRKAHAVQTLAKPEKFDPFATWINMLERQRDRRDGSRYGGVERRSSIAYSHFASK